MALNKLGEAESTICYTFSHPFPQNDISLESKLFSPWLQATWTAKIQIENYKVRFTLSNCKWK